MVGRVRAAVRYLVTGKMDAVVRIVGHRERATGGIEPILDDAKVIRTEGVQDTIQLHHPSGDKYVIRYNVIWKR